MATISHPIRRWMRWALLAGVTAGLPALASDDTVERMDLAQRAYAQRHWHEAFAAFAELAERGHRASALRAAQMHRWGPRLYGTRFPVTDGQVERWTQVARCGQVAGSCSGPAAASAVASADTGR